MRESKKTELSKGSRLSRLLGAPLPLLDPLVFREPSKNMSPLSGFAYFIGRAVGSTHRYKYFAPSGLNFFYRTIGGLHPPL